MKKVAPVVAIILLLVVGFGVLLYPTISNWLFEQNSSYAIAQYGEMVKELDPAIKAEQLQLAREYNDALTGYDVKDPFIPGSGIVLPDNYVSVLNLNDYMGYVEIPKINVHLPIRHGTSEETLLRNVGHIEATAFPIGGANTHCVLTGHRGLAEAKLFTDLDKLEEGDIFLLHVLDDTLAYQVDQILVVEPEEAEALRPVEGMDYTTLITCTPYAINSHRLLVRGIRIPYSAENPPEELVQPAESRQFDQRLFVLLAFVILWALLLLIYMIIRRRKKRRRW